MARPLRVEFAGALYHLTSRGDRREDIYLDDADRVMFLEVLAEVCDRFRWVCHAYCLMSNHYHLLIETRESTLANRQNRDIHKTSNVLPHKSTISYRQAGLFTSRCRHDCRPQPPGRSRCPRLLSLHLAVRASRVAVRRRFVQRNVLRAPSGANCACHGYVPRDRAQLDLPLVTWNLVSSTATIRNNTNSPTMKLQAIMWTRSV